MSTGQVVAFFILSFLAFSGAIMMIAFHRVVHMVVSMATTFLSLAGLYILLEAEFVAVVQVMVYAGAISILMIFGIMMTKHHDGEEEKPTTWKSWFTFGSVAAFLFLVYVSIRNTKFPEQTQQYVSENNVLEIGQMMFNQYAIPFEIISVLLTVAFVGAILIARREEAETE